MYGNYIVVIFLDPIKKSGGQQGTTTWLTATAAAAKPGARKNCYKDVYLLNKVANGLG
jgi:hypothetical protein